MSTANKYAPAVNVQPPRCPYCQTPLPEVNTYQWTKQTAAGLVITLCIYCPNTECSRMMGTQMLIIPHAEEGSMIARPS